MLLQIWSPEVCQVPGGFSDKGKRGQKGPFRLHNWVGISLPLNMMLWELKLGYSTRSDFPNYLSSVTAKALPCPLQQGALPWLGNWKPGEGPGAFRGSWNVLHMQNEYIHMKHESICKDSFRKLKGLKRTRRVFLSCWGKLKWAVSMVDKCLEIALGPWVSLSGRVSTHPHNWEQISDFW